MVGALTMPPLRDHLWFGLAYVCCTATILLAPLFPGAPLMAGLALQTASMAVIFAFSRAFRNSSFFDPWWSLAPMATVSLWAGWIGGPRAGLILLVTLVWGVRLTLNWYRSWGGLGHEDWRYRDVQQKTGRWYWVVSFLGIHGFPAVLVGLGVTPVPAALTSATPLGGWDVAATLVALAAAGIELVADEQLRTFRRSGQTGSIDSGLWRWSRHPNYFGEILFWAALPLYCVAAGTFRPIHLLGVSAMIFLFSVVSIPLMEARQLARRPGYAAYQARTSRLFPLPPRPTRARSP